MPHSTTSSTASWVSRNTRRTTSLTPSETSTSKSQAVPSTHGRGTGVPKGAGTCDFRTRLWGHPGLDAESDSEEQLCQLPLAYGFWTGRRLDLAPEESERSLTGEERTSCGEDVGHGVDYRGLEDFDDDSIFGSHIFATESEILAFESSVDEMPPTSSEPLPVTDARLSQTGGQILNQHGELASGTIVASSPDPAGEFYNDGSDAWSVVTTKSDISTYAPGRIMEATPCRFPLLAGIVRVSSRAARKQLREVESACRVMMLPKRLWGGGESEYHGGGV